MSKIQQEEMTSDFLIKFVSTENEIRSDWRIDCLKVNVFVDFIRHLGNMFLI